MCFYSGIYCTVKDTNCIAITSSATE